VIVFKLPKHFL